MTSEYKHFVANAQLGSAAWCSTPQQNAVSQFPSPSPDPFDQIDGAPTLRAGSVEAGLAAKAAEPVADACPCPLKNCTGKKRPLDRSA